MPNPPPVLTQVEIEKLTPEEYTNFLAFGDPKPPELDEEQYERYLLSHQIFDL